MKKGYKQTELGLIPEDWEVKTLGEIGKFSKGSGIKKDEAQSGSIPCVRYGELYTRHDNRIKNFFSFISKDISETAKKLKNGDILFAGSGETKEEIGKSAVFIGNIEAYAGGDIVIFSPISVEPLYLGYLLNAPVIQKQKASRGQGDAVVHISANQLGNMFIPFPPTLYEQRAIAAALSDADDLVSGIEKLIAKKRDLKQGAMQMLLQPKEGWERKRLGEVAEMFSGGTPLTSNTNYYNGDIPWVVIADITKAGKYIFETEKTISNEGLLNSSAKLFKKGVLLFAMYASIGKATISMIDTSCNQAILGILPHSIDREYLYYFLFYNEKKFATMG